MTPTKPTPAKPTNPHPLVTVERVEEGSWSARTGRKRGAVVEKLSHRVTQRTAEVRLDKNALEFSAQIGDEIGVSKDGPAVKAWAMDLLGRQESIEWTPVIEIALSIPDNDNGSDDFDDEPAETLRGDLTLEATRYYVGRTKGGRWRKLAWERYADTADTNRASISGTWSIAERDENGDRRSDAQQAKFALPYVSKKHYGTATYCLAFDANAWAGLAHICRMVDKAHETIAALLSTADGQRQLGAIGEGSGQLRLTAGGKT